VRAQFEIKFCYKQLIHVTALALQATGGSQWEKYALLENANQHHKHSTKVCTQTCIYVFWLKSNKNSSKVKNTGTTSDDLMMILE
jgi:hypothetical protein